MPTRTPEEILAAIEEQAADDEMESVLAMTPEQRRDELRAAGFDLDAGDAEADKVHAATLGPASSVTAIRRRTPLRLVMIAAAAIALVLAAFTVMAVIRSRGETVASPNLDLDPVPSNVPPARELREAVALRRQAAAACDQKNLPECVTRLEQARVLDPAGDTSQDAQAIHRQIDALQRDRAQHGGDKP